MRIPIFKLAIVSVKDEIIVSTFGGEKLEVSFSEAVLNKLSHVPLGIFTSRSRVETAVAQAIRDVCVDLKMRSADALRIGMANVVQ